MDINRAMHVATYAPTPCPPWPHECANNHTQGQHTPLATAINNMILAANYQLDPNKNALTLQARITKAVMAASKEAALTKEEPA